MRSFFYISALFLFARFGFAIGDPYLVEGKVHSDLDAMLSRLVPREQFLVQVNADISIRTEKRVTEGESVASNPEPEAPHIAPMPGFVPERDPTVPPKPIQSRQSYRVVEVPQLNIVRVKVDLDEELAAEKTMRAKAMVQDYLRTNYANRSSVDFTMIPMLKPPKPEPPKLAVEEPLKRKPAAEDDEKKKSPPPPTPEEVLWNYARWAMMALLLAVLILQMRKNASPVAVSFPGGGAGGLGSGAGFGGMDPMEWARKFAAGGAGSSKGRAKKSKTDELSSIRRRLLEKFITHSEAFRFFYDVLDVEKRSEIYSALRGPAFEKLMDVLNLVRPPVNEVEPHDLDARILIHEKNFDEYAKAKDWQDKQFFGFLHTLSDEQLIALVNHESPLSVCIMIRYLKPQQSAFVLDSLGSARRSEVLANVNKVKTIPFSDLLAIEREIRGSVSRMPTHLYGSKKEDVDFWGSVLAESHDQDTLLQDIEKTNPEIYSNVARFKFRLEDAASLPDALLNKVLSDCDNEEIGMALASLKSDIAEVFLDAVSSQRRSVLEAQVASYRRAPKNQITEARLKLTRKIREVMA